DLVRPGPAFLLAAFALVWVSGFDIIYATLDEAFDCEHGVRSMVAWLGRRRALDVSAALHRVAQLVLLALVVVLLRAGGAAPWSPGGLVALALWAGAAALLELEQRWAEDVNLASATSPPGDHG